MEDKDPIAKAAETAAKTHPPRVQVATQDLAELKSIYPIADVSQLAAQAQEGDAEAILANTQVKIQFGTKKPE